MSRQYVIIELIYFTLIPMVNLCAYLLVSKPPHFSIAERPNVSHIATYTTYHLNF